MPTVPHPKGGEGGKPCEAPRRSAESRQRGAQPESKESARTSNEPPAMAPPTPAAGIPTGTVLFLANGQPLAAPVLLSAGMASAGTETLPLWDSVITAAYLGDSNFLGSTNALGQLVRPRLELPRVVSIVDNGNGTVTVTCHGTPAVEHYIEATATVDVPLSWVCVSTNTAGMWDGFWTYTEEKGQNTQRFFRAVKPY